MRGKIILKKDKYGDFYLDTFKTYKYDGFAVLADLVAKSAFKTIEQAVASLALFSHPDTVAQTQHKPLFRSVRNVARRGQIEELQGCWIAYDDNKSPTDAVLWCNMLSRKDLADVQFNHIYQNSQDPDLYTSLANLCVTPAFLAKLTDTHSRISALLQYRSFELYGWAPSGKEVPKKPANYDNLFWAPPLPPIEDVAATVRAVMVRRPKDRTVQIVRRIGWLFSNYCPEPATPIVEPPTAGHGASSLVRLQGAKKKRPTIPGPHAKLQALGDFAQIFSDPNFRFQEMHSPKSSEPNVVIAPYGVLSDEANAFLRTIEDHGWIVPFDWPAWAETAEARALLSNPAAASWASTDQLSKLLTALVRKEQFCEGTLSEAHESGILAAVARRALVLQHGL